MINFIVSYPLAPYNTLATIHEKKFSLSFPSSDVSAMSSLTHFIGTWYNKDVGGTVIYSRCSCLAGKIRSVGERLKHNSSTKRGARGASSMPKGEQTTRQWETEGDGKEWLERTSKSWGLQDGWDLDRQKGKGERSPKHDLGKRMWQR